MKKNIKNLSMFAGLSVVTHNDVVDPEYVPTDSDMDRILREIYSVDEKTGLPQGDLVYYLSPDGNPQVRSWLENNLLKPRAVANGTSVDGVTDDMLAEYSKLPGESVSDYAIRLRGIYDTAADDIRKFKENVNKNADE